MRDPARPVLWLSVAGVAAAIAHLFVPGLPSLGGYAAIVNFKDPALVWGADLLSVAFPVAIALGCGILATGSRRRMAIGAGIMVVLAAIAIREAIAFLMFAYALVHVIPEDQQPSMMRVFEVAGLAAITFEVWGIAARLLWRASREPAVPPMPVPAL